MALNIYYSIISWSYDESVILPQSLFTVVSFIITMFAQQVSRIILFGHCKHIVCKLFLLCKLIHNFYCFISFHYVFKTDVYLTLDTTSLWTPWIFNVLYLFWNYCFIVYTCNIMYISSKVSFNKMLEIVQIALDCSLKTLLVYKIVLFLYCLLWLLEWSNSCCVIWITLIIDINIPTLNLSQDDLIKYAIPRYTSGEIKEQTVM